MYSGISEIKLLEENFKKIASFEKRCPTIIENLRDGFVVVNTSLQILYINNAFAEMLDYKTGDIIGKNLLEFTAYPRDQIALLNGIIRRAKNYQDNYDLHFCTQKGGIILTNIAPTPYLDDTGKLVASFAVVKNLSEIQKKENILQYQAHLLRYISEGVIVTNPSGEIDYFNPTAEEILEFNLSDVLHKSVFNLFPLDRSHYIELVKDNFPLGKGVYEELEYITPAGIKKHLRVSTAILKNNALFIGTVTIVSDITELVTSRQEAEKANNAKSEFLANITHDLRNPMIGVLGATDLLSQESLNDYQTDLVQTVQKSGKQLLELINDILDLSRIEAGYALGTIKEFNLSELINECLETTSRKINVNNLQLIKAISPQIPTNLIGDAIQLRRVILNLLDNSVKFTPEGYIKIEITPLKHKQENEIILQFSIEDTGIGIPATQIKNVFEAFHQIDNHDNKGTGLGLAICKQLIENMRGEIWVNSGVNQGSIFTFQLPFQRPFNNIATNTNPVARYSPATTAAKSILVVDDNLTNAKILSYMLKNAGYLVQQAANGQACLDILDKVDIDLIIMDMHMPILNGYETSKIIRNSTANYNNVPIVALTAYTLTGDFAHCINAGCNYHLTKPISSSELYLVLEKILDKNPTNHSAKANIKEELPEFFATTTILIDKLKSNIENMAYEEITRICHQIKEAALPLGYINLSNATDIVFQYAIYADNQKLQLAFTNLRLLFSHAKKTSLN